MDSPGTNIIVDSIFFNKTLPFSLAFSIGALIFLFTLGYDNFQIFTTKFYQNFTWLSVNKFLISPIILSFCIFITVSYLFEYLRTKKIIGLKFERTKSKLVLTIVPIPLKTTLDYFIIFGMCVFFLLELVIIYFFTLSTMNS